MTSRRGRLTARVIGLVLGAALAWNGPAAAHVGSPDTWFEGAAGPYPIRVVVRAPDVVPGLAEIEVRVLAGRPQRVTVQPFAWNAGQGGAPPPDVASAVPGDPRLYHVSLWFMSPTSYGVHVVLSGPQGEGTAIIPVQAVALRLLPMDRGLMWVLLALCAFLFVGLVTIFGAAVGESPVPAGQEPEHARARRAKVVMAVSALVLAVALFLGQAWWKGVDRSYAMDLYRPFQSSASVIDSSGARLVRLTVDDPRWRARQWTPLIADHGKLMHLFLVRADDLGAIAHLHPVPLDSSSFAARLPSLPAGRYRVYGDIVHESGFAQTLSATLDLAETFASAPAPSANSPTATNAHPAAAASLAFDPDDAWFVGAATPPSDASGADFPLADGSIMTWERGSEPLLAGRDATLRFRVTRPDGTPVTLEPYMGMVAHALVTLPDGAVFAHLHPTGTVSMASQMALTMRTPADSLPGSLGRRIAQADAMGGHAMHGMPTASGPVNTFSIPYGFPRDGRYRIWVQVKVDGAVRTAAFDADVRGASPRS